MSIKKIIAIGSAKGGVGKSSITALLALSLSKHKKVGILDADIYGPNQNILFNLDSKKTIINKKIMPAEKKGIKIALKRAEDADLNIVIIEPKSVDFTLFLDE